MSSSLDLLNSAGVENAEMFASLFDKERLLAENVVANNSTKPATVLLSYSFAGKTLVDLKLHKRCSINGSKS